MIRMIAYTPKLYFATRAMRYTKDAEYCLDVYPRDSLGYMKGEFLLRLSNFYFELSIALPPRSGEWIAPNKEL